MYLLDDPLTPELNEEAILPVAPTLPFAFAQPHLNCEITLYRTVNYFQQIIDSPLVAWAGKKPLIVNPYGDKNQINAWYSRKALSFHGQGEIQTVDSADVVAHELGHALLDALRPDFWHVQSLEVWAFHEAWSDITAIVLGLQSEKMIEHILKETNGDLRKSNLVSKIASQVGQVCYDRDYLRDAARKYTYVRPQTLPKKTADEELAAESHSFSRVFASAWYEFFVRLYEKSGSIQQARDHAYRCLIKAAATTPVTVEFLSATAKNIVLFDTESLAREVFTQWKIIRPTIKMLSTLDFDSFQKKPTDRILKNGQNTIVRRKTKNLFKLSDYVVTALADDPLFHIKMEVPNESYFEFNENGLLIDQVVPSSDEIVESTLACLSHIEIGKMWKIRSNRLERAYI